MEKILKKINEDKIMIGFVILVLLASIYMGMNERRLDNINNSNHNNSAVLNIK